MISLRPHEDTAKLRAHYHTSYHGLLVVLVLGGMLMSLVTMGALAPSQADSGAIDVTATVPGPPPTTAPVLTFPADGSNVSTQQVSVGGSCSGDDTIVVMSNGAVRGSAFCDHTGQFSLVLALDKGSNAIVAHYVDNLNQNGPDSNTLTLIYQPAAPSASPVASSPARGTTTGGKAAAGAAPLTVTAPARFNPFQSGTSLSLVIDVEGGTPPYALNINWGDGQQTLLSRLVAGKVTQTHTYARPGRYQVRLSLSDVTGATSFFQTVLQVVGGGAAGAAPATPAPAVSVPFSQLEVAWPLFLGLCLVVLSFWLGERYDRRHWRSPPPTA